MQDLDYDIAISNFLKLSGHKPIARLSEGDRERMKKSPHEMYFYSLATGSRLPDDLHESMLIHSFDPEADIYVRDYFEWVLKCDENDRRMAAARSFERLCDRLVLGSMISFATLTWALFLLWMALK